MPARLDQAEELRATIIREARPKWFILTGMMFPGFLKGIGKNAESTARHRLAWTALAVEQYRLAMNRLPAALDNLSAKYLPEVPKDPFSQEELLYRPQESSYVIYSLGPDREDDGGTKPISRDQKLDNPKGDIVFVVSRLMRQ